MKIKFLLAAVFSISVSLSILSQTTSNIQQPTSVNTSGLAPDASAILDVQSTNMGMLVPRMTTAQRTAIAWPAVGLLVFDTDTGSFWFYDGTAWTDLSAQLADADNDTKVQVEESADEDVIRFDVAGSERLKITIDSSVFKGQLQVDDGAVLFEGTTGGTPVSGGGTRLMWVPEKAAFRAGLVNSAQWDDANIGVGSSVAGGEDNTASGDRSFVGGGSVHTASGNNSFIGGGSANTASSTGSFVGGGSVNTASNNFSFVGGGITNTASGNYSFVGCGIGNTASVDFSFVGGGTGNTASSVGSFVGGGFGHTASGVGSFVGGGDSLLARSYSEAVFGLFNTDYTPTSTNSFDASDRLFVIGNGIDDVNRSNAVTVLKSGRFGIGRIPSNNLLEVEGEASKTNAGNWLANSDARLKTNICPLDSEEILQKMLALRGITYEWNDEVTGSKRPEGTMYGFTAQNIREVFPTLVTEDNLGFLQTAYGTYDAMTVEAMRALHAKIEEQQTEIEDLQSQLGQVDALKSELTSIRQALEKVGIAPE